jgi:hypothetical protein
MSDTERERIIEIITRQLNHSPADTITRTTIEGIADAIIVDRNLEPRVRHVADAIRELGVSYSNEPETLAAIAIEAIDDYDMRASADELKRHLTGEEPAGPPQWAQAAAWPAPSDVLAFMVRVHSYLKAMANRQAGCVFKPADRIEAKALRDAAIEVVEKLQGSVTGTNYFVQASARPPTDVG